MHMYLFIDLSVTLREYGKEGNLERGTDAHARVTVALLWKQVGRADVTAQLNAKAKQLFTSLVCID